MSTEANAPAASAAAPAAPSAPADSGVPAQPAASAPPAEGQDKSSAPDLSELHPAVRESIEREIETRAQKAAEEKMRAEYAEKWSWIPKEKREHFAKNRAEFDRMEERAAKAEAYEKELAQLRAERQNRREDEPAKPKPPSEPKQEDLEDNILDDFSKDYELDESDKKFYKGLIGKAISKAEARAEARVMSKIDEIIDRRLGLHEDIKAVRSDPRWSDPEIGDALQFATQGIMALAEKQGRPMTWAQAKEMASGMKAFQPRTPPPAPATAPAKPAPAAAPAAVTPPRLGDAGGGSPNSGGKDIDVYDDDQLLSLFKQDPNVKSHFARSQ